MQLGEVTTHDHGRKDSRVGLDRSEDESTGDGVVGCRDSYTQYLNTPGINKSSTIRIMHIPPHMIVRCSQLYFRYIQQPPRSV